MITLTAVLEIASLSSFGDGIVAPGFFFLLVMVVSALLTFWILKWLIQSIQSEPGTSFKKANFSNTDFSHSEVQNTELLREIAIVLFQQERITLGRASLLCGMDQIEFQKLLASRGVSIHYGIEDYEADLKSICEDGW